MLTLPFARSPLVFTVFSIITCFGSGHAPAAQSVALALYAHRGGVESGKLLGALGVLQVVWCVFQFPCRQATMLC